MENKGNCQKKTHVFERYVKIPKLIASVDKDMKRGKEYNKTTKIIEESFNYYDYNKKKIDNFDDSTNKNDFLSIYLSSLLTFRR